MRSSSSSGLENQEDQASLLKVVEKAAEICKSDREETEFVEVSDKAAFLTLYDCLFHQDPAVRKAAQSVLKLVQSPPCDVNFAAPELAEKLMKDGFYHKWMMTEALEAANKDALVAWDITVRLMGKTLHLPKTGVQAVNHLLQIVELAFKHTDLEFRKQSYESWKVLMTNFALDPKILTNSKRIKLIIRPLTVSYSLLSFFKNLENLENFVV